MNIDEMEEKKEATWRKRVDMVREMHRAKYGKCKERDSDE